MDSRDGMNPNIYGQCKGPASKAEIAKAYENHGWNVRKCTWCDFEISNAFAELIIDGDDHDNLIHGFIEDAQHNTNAVEMVLNSLGMSWSLEEYDQNSTLIRSYSSNWDSDPGQAK